ncbi:MAG: hypothetical protein ACOCWM_02755 [Cyclobacteriaceae bacterium]
MTILRKIKELVRENREYHQETQLMLKELHWADIYHDSIRGTEWLEKLPLNIGRWAGGYSFFYILNRVLKDYKPEKILELGLGESSKFISAYADNNDEIKSHTIIEQNVEWKNSFEKQHTLSKKSLINICEVQNKEVQGFQTKVFSNLNEKINLPYDLYVIDGPIGCERYSRYDIIEIAEGFKSKDEFIIVFDDVHREGEMDTVNDLLKLLKKKEVTVYFNQFLGIKKVFVLATAKFKHVISI